MCGALAYGQTSLGTSYCHSPLHILSFDGIFHREKRGNFLLLKKRLKISVPHAHSGVIPYPSLALVPFSSSSSPWKFPALKIHPELCEESLVFSSRAMSGHLAMWPVCGSRW